MKDLETYIIEEQKFYEDANKYLVNADNVGSEYQIDEGILDWIKNFFSKAVNKISEYIKRNKKEPKLNFKANDLQVLQKPIDDLSDSVKAITDKVSGWTQLPVLLKNRDYITNSHYINYTYNTTANNPWAGATIIPVCYIGWLKKQEDVTDTLKLSVFEVNKYVAENPKMFVELFKEYCRAKLTKYTKLSIDLDKTNLEAYAKSYTTLGFKQQDNGSVYLLEL